MTIDIESAHSWGGLLEKLLKSCGPWSKGEEELMRLGRKGLC